ncbi:MAG: response regulator [Lachnospiraceae bacterium]|nr:response regulator [Lachnospiraceae bacterium]
MRLIFIIAGLLSECLLLAILLKLVKKKTLLDRSVVRIFSAASVGVFANIVIALSGIPIITHIAFTLYFLSIDFMTYYLLIFAFVYTNRVRFLRKFVFLWRFIILIDGINLTLSIVTGHMYTMYSMVLSDGSTAYQTRPSALFNVHLLLCYLPIVFALFLLTLSLVRSYGFYRFKYFPILLSLTFIVILNIAYMLFSLPFDWSVLFYALAGLLLYYYSLFYVPRKLMNNTLNLAVDSMKEGLFLFDIDKNCIYINKTASDIFNLSTESYKYGDFPISLWTEGRDINDLDEFEVTFPMDINGREAQIRVDYRNCVNQAKQKLGSFFLFEDVTEDHLMMKNLEEARAEANRANKAKSLFLANMSHEIRTPINSILGMNEMILRESAEESILDYAGDIERSGEALLSLINNILDISKIESGKMEIIPEEYNLHKMLQESLILVRPRAKQKDLPINVECDPLIPSGLYGDFEKIKQVLINLLTNSIKYTDKGIISLKIIWKDLNEETGNLIIEVSDTGQGISEEDFSKIFKAFQRVNEEKNKAVEGTGLGLALSRQLIEMMDGTISVTSVQSEGSEFTVNIPQKIMNKKPLGEFDPGRKSELRRNNYKELFHAPDAEILVVDDVEVNLKLVSALLKKTEINITTVKDGFKALELCQNKDFDLILMDHMMPNCDGYETMKMIRKDGGNNKKIPIIVLTANAVEGSENHYLEMGFDSYLAKPIVSSDLEETLKKFLPEEKIILL